MRAYYIFMLMMARGDKLRKKKCTKKYLAILIY